MSMTIKEAMHGIAGIAGVLMLVGGMAGVCTAISGITGTLFQPVLMTGLSLIVGGTIAMVFHAQVLTDDEKDKFKEKMMTSVSEFFGHETADQKKDKV